MGDILRACLYNLDAASSQQLRDQISALNFVRLAAEVGSAEELASALPELNANLVFFHLDPNADPVIETIEQVATKYPELALIAIGSKTGPQEILAPMRAGCDQFVCKPVDHGDLASAVARVANKRLLSRMQGRCICVAGASGGAGTTSLACNLALELGMLAERDCAVVDLDLQFGDVALNFDCDPKYTLYDLAGSAGELDRSILIGTMTSLPCKVALLARPKFVDQHASITPEIVHRVIELLTAEYSNVVIDLPRYLEPCGFTALKQADLVLIVCQLLVPSVSNARRLHEALVSAGIPPERIEIVINRSDSSSQRITAKDIEETINKPVFASIPNDYQFVARSLDYGRPVAAIDRSNAVRSAIRKMAKRIAGESDPTAKAAAPKRGLFSRLFD